ncbi:CaiB/BaiF CoA transferase family protein [Brevibacterium sp. UCMA 11754]|uniref:CaiB/BaiF CoA transferase family protein n=1 Tax=Brevibacterium sp. UCMA 11754 TaxID=2749198 RepID=UPI001F3009C2|nr:CoA transferase [Brevibacterium sp. UCMA 11754]MCF2570829.1 CoA transferase [Brevibacterium sp. UCMA 11754]
MSTQPLQGLTILDLGQYISAPLAGQNFADMGAQVIKIEPLHGEQARNIGLFGDTMVEACNRGKTSCALDLSTEEGRATFYDMAATADVVIHNFLPRTAVKLGVDWSTLSQRFPQLICGVVSGFGRLGPHAGSPGLDIMAQAEFGVLGLTGEADGEPQRVGFAVADVLASHALTSGVLAAVVARDRDGHGSLVETSLMEATVHAQGAQWAEYAMTGQAPTRKGNGQPHAAPAAEVITVNGSSFVLSAYTDAKWTALCKAIGREDLLGDDKFATNRCRVENRPALLEAITNALSGMSAVAAVDMLRESGIVCGLIRTLDEIREDPDLQASGMLSEVESSAGERLLLPTLPVVFNGERGDSTQGAPPVGAGIRVTN